ncbi:MAG: hypothetical protein HZB16_14035 [Armatimonadetes bacterium]|nr:hypothetical protein [Armatimonadota bacterium]
MTRLSVWCLLLSAGLACAQVGEPVTLRLSVGPDLAWRFVESLHGKGTLTRVRGLAETAVGVEVRADGTRLWRFLEPADNGSRLSARSMSAKASLRLVDAPADGQYQRERPFRSYSLLVTPAGAVLDAELLTDAQPAEPGANEPPVELDLTELFTALELGLLPPLPVALGGSWQLPADNAEQDRSKLALQAKGKLVERSETTAGSVAVLDTSLTAALPSRPTPIKELLVSGQVALSARVRFNQTLGRVDHVAGPLTLDLRYAYPDARGVVAKVRLELALEARQEVAMPAR